MVGQLDASVVAAAGGGDQAALDELIAHYLPLVYNIVGRALSRPSDVDDVVQDTMLRLVRGLAGVRDPGSFRSWLVAVTMNQVRGYHQSQSRIRSRVAGDAPVDELDDLADPGADFEDLTLTRLGLSGQRREVAMATTWLDADDRDLLSLWWLVEAGHLTRAELVNALELTPHHVTVRVARMKGQLDTGRQVVRALCARPGCPDLLGVAADWSGKPNSVWRKRFARHIRECAVCPDVTTELIPAERLLAGLALTPLPIGFAAYVLSHAHGVAAAGFAASASAYASGSAMSGSVTSGSLTSSPVTSSPVTTSSARIPGQRAAAHRAGGHAARSTSKALLGKAAIAATAGAALLTGYAVIPNALAPSGPTQAGMLPGLPGVPQHSATTIAPTTVPTTASTTVSTTPPASTRPTVTTTTPKPKPTTTSPSASTSAASSQQSPEQQVLAVINQARASAGLPPLTMSSGLISSATAHNQTMAAGCGLSHQCPGEAGLGDRATSAGVHWSALGENIGEGGPVSATNASIAKMAVGLTQSMLDEKPPDDGHRKNILSTSYHHIGIVVFRDAKGTVWMTQDFSN